MNISRRMSYLLIAVGAFVVASIVFIYIAIPFGPRGSALNDFQQLVRPLDLNNVEARQALQTIVDSASRPLRIRICKDLAAKRITIKTVQPETVRHVMGDIAVQLQASIGDENEPHFRCKSLFEDSIEIKPNHLGM